MFQRVKKSNVATHVFFSFRMCGVVILDVVLVFKHFDVIVQINICVLLHCCF